MNLPRIDESVAGKRVLVRGDIDVPLVEGKISDDTRLKNIKPTIDFLVEKKCQVILMGHLGRPGGKVVPELSSKPVAEWFGGQIEVLENLRFDVREEANDEGFARELAEKADAYVNESFAESHRQVASIVGVPKLLPHFAGLRLEKEVETLGEVLESPRRPLLVVIGGAKMETKIPVIGRMAQVAECVLVGGKLIAEITIGSEIMKMEKVKILRLTADGKDTTLESIDKSLEVINTAGTIVWNGPLGMIEDYTYQVGTRRLAEVVAHTKAKKIVGGGDTVGFIQKLGILDQYDFVSSGGGAMLAFLAGEVLPGIEVLLN